MDKMGQMDKMASQLQVIIQYSGNYDVASYIADPLIINVMHFMQQSVLSSGKWTTTTMIPLFIR